ncbi:FecR domain-containing protein [Chitinophaga sancti]|uniref:FecR family protein n=1 Tax=Chitinophaga sancti TaxID=1004 RepID=UPI002A74B932|nr:FecR domain-containing protein [Chitinophaga sancti]WPQ63381.1 FecR domain-containing protein [Chitinophaga sancti]
MPIPPDFVEKLVLEKISGVITPEHSALLDKLLAESEEAQAIWKELRELLPDSYLDKIKTELESSLPMERILRYAQEEETRRRKYRYRIALLAPVTLLAIGGLCYLGIVKSTSQNQALAKKERLLSSSITLSLPGQSPVILGQQYATFNSKGAAFHEEKGALSWTGKTKPEPATLTVPVTKQYKVTLPDGTKIMLNAASSIQFPLNFGKGNREITLLTGEAFIEVAKDPSHPFLVHLPNNTIQVLGTAFNVDTYEKNLVKVALTSGKITLRSGSYSTTLSPGQLAISETGKQIKINTFDQDSLLAWKDGVYDYDEASLQEVMNAVSRTFGILVVFDDPGVESRKLKAYFTNTDTLSVFMKNLNTAQVCNYTFTGTGMDSVLHIKEYKK